MKDGGNKLFPEISKDEFVKMVMAMDEDAIQEFAATVLSITHIGINCDIMMKNGRTAEAERIRSRATPIMKHFMEHVMEQGKLSKKQRDELTRLDKESKAAWM